MNHWIAACALLAFASSSSATILYHAEGVCDGLAIPTPGVPVCQAGAVAHVEVILPDDYVRGTMLAGVIGSDLSRVISISYWDDDIRVYTGDPLFRFLFNAGNQAIGGLSLPSIGVRFSNDADSLSAENGRFRLIGEVSVNHVIGYTAAGPLGPFHIPEPAALPLSLAAVYAMSICLRRKKPRG